MFQDITYLCCGQASGSGSFPICHQKIYPAFIFRCSYGRTRIWNSIVTFSRITFGQYTIIHQCRISSYHLFYFRVRTKVHTTYSHMNGNFLPFSQITQKGPGLFTCSREHALIGGNRIAPFVFKPPPDYTLNRTIYFPFFPCGQFQVYFRTFYPIHLTEVFILSGSLSCITIEESQITSITIGTGDVDVLEFINSGIPGIHCPLKFHMVEYRNIIGIYRSKSPPSIPWFTLYLPISDTPPTRSS